MDIRLKLTKHADDKRRLEGITIDQIKTAIKRGSISKQTDGFLAHYSYIKVAYKKIGKNVYKIKTVFVG